MPPKPNSAAWRNVSTGKSSSSSHCRANGIISSRAKARAVSWMARCSSLRSKSMWVARLSAARLSEHPRGRIGDRLVLVQRQQALDVAHQRPDEPPEYHQDADEHECQDHADEEIEEPDPERADLKAVVSGEHGIGGGDLHVGDDHADERSEPGHVRHEIE